LATTYYLFNKHSFGKDDDDSSSQPASAHCQLHIITTSDQVTSYPFFDDFIGSTQFLLDAVPVTTATTGSYLNTQFKIKKKTEKTSAKGKEEKSKVFFFIFADRRTY